MWAVMLSRLTPVGKMFAVVREQIVAPLSKPGASAVKNSVAANRLRPDSKFTTVCKMRQGSLFNQPVRVVEQTGIVNDASAARANPVVPITQAPDSH